MSKPLCPWGGNNQKSSPSTSFSIINVIPVHPNLDCQTSLCDTQWCQDTVFFCFVVKNCIASASKPNVACTLCLKKGAQGTESFGLVIKYVTIMLKMSFLSERKAPEQLWLDGHLPPSFIFLIFNTIIIITIVTINNMMLYLMNCSCFPLCGLRYLTLVAVQRLSSKTSDSSSFKRLG